jgi:hypothetical protein
MSAASEDDRSTASAGENDEQLTLGARVWVYPETDAESLGVILDDLGEMSGLYVRVGANQIASPARRWAVALDDGTLVFVDGDQITAY